MNNHETMPLAVDSMGPEQLRQELLAQQQLCAVQAREIFRLQEKLHLADHVFSSAREGVLVTDLHGVITDVNPAFQHITGYRHAEVLGQNPRLLGSGRHEPAFFASLWHDLLHKGHWYGEVWNRRKSGEVFAVVQTITAVRNTHNELTHFVAIFSDITTSKAHQEELEHITHYDALTGLPNRALLVDRLRQGVSQAQRRGQLLAVVFLDLDGFKAINDQYGHDVGDHLLVTLAARMKLALREGDTLARIGGDEFVAVLVDLSDVSSSVPMLTRLLAAAAQPVSVGERMLQASASLGVTFTHVSDDTDSDLLLRQAHQAMYQAKLAGKNRYHVFDAAQDRSVRGHHENLDHIRKALVQRQFVLHYQPKVDMRSGKVVGVEALIRWQHPLQGLLLPRDFLPVVEDHPLSIDIGEWVIETALTQMEIWHAAGLVLPVSLNVGARQLQHPDFVLRLQAALARHPTIDAHHVELEILETSALEDVAAVSQAIHACRDLGVMFALDDFGTGYSSLTYLKRLSVALLKIDQSFVRDMLSDPDDLAILEGIIGLARAFRRSVVAEGVETVEHGTMLLQLGCRLAQGFGISRPMPPEALPGWIQTWQPDPKWRDAPVIHRNGLPLLVACVEHRAWTDAVVELLKDDRAHTTLLVAHAKRFGRWIEAEALTRFSSLVEFQAIVYINREAHELADALLESKAQGRRSQALARVHDLYNLRDILLGQLTQLACQKGL